MHVRRNTYYLISLCLCLWYLVICWLAFYPNVSNEYRLYYIERKLQTWPGTNGKL